MDYVALHGFPRHLSQTASLSMLRKSDAQNYCTPIFLEKESEKKYLDGSLWQPALHISFTYSSHVSSFYFSLTVSFIPAGMDQNISVEYAQKNHHCERKRHAEIKTHLWAVPS